MFWSIWGRWPDWGRCWRCQSRHLLAHQCRFWAHVPGCYLGLPLSVGWPCVGTCLSSPDLKEALFLSLITLSPPSWLFSDEAPGSPITPEPSKGDVVFLAIKPLDNVSPETSFSYLQLITHLFYPLPLLKDMHSFFSSHLRSNTEESSLYKS